MAVRTISTKLVVDGEAEYKQAITACNAQLSLLKSGLAATASEFRNNANSLAALTAKDEKLNELKAAQAEKIQKLKDALENCRKAAEQYARQQETLQAKVQASDQAVASLDASSQKAGKRWAEYAQEVEKSERALEVLRRLALIGGIGRAALALWIIWITGVICLVHTGSFRFISI